MSDTSQQDRQEYGIDITEQRQEPAASSRSLRWYVAALLAFPFVLVLGSLAWMASPAYQQHAQIPSFVAMGYGSRLRGADCQIVIDGDSSALTGMIPAVIEQRTGLKTCNIAEVAGVKSITGFAELEDYLAHNRPPRYLLFMFVPENLTPPRGWYEVGHFEGWFYGLRFHRGLVLHQALHDPTGLVIAAEEGFPSGLRWLLHSPLPPQLTELRERNQGWLDEPGHPLTGCAEPLRISPPDPDWLRWMRTHFSTQGTRVLIDVTPEPPCDPSLAFYQARTGPGITDNRLQTMPLADYTDTGRLHTNATGAQAFSERVAAQIAALAAAPAGVPPATASPGSR